MCADLVKPVVPKPTAAAVEEGLSRPQAEMATCDADTEMDCLGDGTVCVAIDQLCDGQSQCPHGEDEDPGNCAYYDGQFSHHSLSLSLSLARHVSIYN